MDNDEHIVRFDLFTLFIPPTWEIEDRDHVVNWQIA